MAEVDWHSYGVVVSSEYRKKVLFTLKDKPMTPKDISKTVELRLSHVSHVLAELADLGLVECLTPELRKGRLYALTAMGKEILMRTERVD